jgi:hypothetical protein
VVHVVAVVVVHQGNDLDSDLTDLRDTMLLIASLATFSYCLMLSQ